jgi:predicted RNA-binding protein with PIN domain
VADLTARLRRMRKARAAAERLVAAGASGRPTDPVAAARDLDLAAAAVPRRAEPAPTLGVEEAGRRRDAFRLPHGVGPDSGAAVRWLAARTEPFTVVVDGYNLLFHLDPGEFTTGTARRGLADLMARFARAADGVRRVLVVFDSALTGERRSRPVDERVEMRFAPSDRSADEEIVMLAQELAGDVVVVSSDREVIDGADSAGALPLWSEAFVAWRG